MRGFAEVHVTSIVIVSNPSHVEWELEKALDIGKIMKNIPDQKLPDTY